MGVSSIFKTKLQFRNWTSDILQASMSIEKQIKVRAEAEQIVQHENTSDRIGSMLQLQALAAYSPHTGTESRLFTPAPSKEGVRVTGGQKLVTL